MIRENKLKYLISSIIIIIPSIISLFIKESFSGMLMSAWYFTWICPLVLFLLHTFLLCITKLIDPVKQNKKIENMMFFIIPAISLCSGGIFIAIASGLEFSIGVVIHLILGIAFILMGNYMPKAKRNRTFGVKLRWTVANDDNWAATHRFTGKLWVVCGILTLPLALIPFNVSIFIFIGMLFVAVIPPIIYSYRFYKRQIASGEATEDDYKDYPKSKNDKRAMIISLVAVGVSLVLIAVLMFVGGIKYSFDDEALTVKPTFGGGITLSYSELADAEIEYRDGGVDGIRVVGFASAKLLYGQFQNDEFGNYVRYTDTDSKSVIVIRTAEETVVLSGESTEDTRAIYDELLVKISEAKG